jgi:hypothetical protein
MLLRRLVALPFMGGLAVGPGVGMAMAPSLISAEES